MLDLNYIRNNKEEILTGLDKRNFEAPQLLDDIIALDQQRRSQQTELDALLAQANNLAKEIGSLFKTEQAEKAAPLKEKSTALKSQTKPCRRPYKNQCGTTGTAYAYSQRTAHLCS